MAVMHPAKGQSGDGTGSPKSETKPKTPGSGIPGSRQFQSESDERLNKCLSGKAIALGKESGVTAEFIIH